MMIIPAARTSIRTIIRNKAFALINIGGLSLGVSCAIIVGLILKHEICYDSFHANLERITLFDANFANEPVVVAERDDCTPVRFLLEPRPEAVKRTVESYDENWQLLQIRSPTEAAVPLMFRRLN